MIDDQRAAQILSGQPITTEEAVSLFADLAAKYQGTLNDHRILQAAVAHLIANTAPPKAETNGDGTVKDLAAVD